MPPAPEESRDKSFFLRDGSPESVHFSTRSRSTPNDTHTLKANVSHVITRAERKRDSVTVSSDVQSVTATERTADNSVMTDLSQGKDKLAQSRENQPNLRSLPKGRRMSRKKVVDMTSIDKSQALPCSGEGQSPMDLHVDGFSTEVKPTKAQKDTEITGKPDIEASKPEAKGTQVKTRANKKEGSPTVLADIVSDVLTGPAEGTASVTSKPASPPQGKRRSSGLKKEEMHSKS